MDDDIYKEEETGQILPYEVELLIQNNDKDNLDISLTNKVKNKMAEFISYLKVISPFNNPEEFIKAVDNLTLLCKYFDYSIISQEYPDFLINLLDITSIDNYGAHYNKVFYLLAEIAMKSPTSAKDLIQYGYLNLLYTIINNVFPPEMKAKAYDVCYTLCCESKNLRDQVLLKFPMRSLYFSALGESNSIILQSIMKLTQSCALYPLDIAEVEYAFNIFKFCFINDGTKDISINARRYALKGIYLLISGKMNSYKEFFNYLDVISNFYGTDPIVSEFISYIVGDLINPKIPLTISLDALADTLFDDNSSPKLISAVSRCIGLIVLNNSSVVEEYDNIEFFIKLCDLFDTVAFSAKNELGFAIIALTTVLPRDVVLSLMIGDCSITFSHIFQLKDPQVLLQAVLLLKEMMQLAYTKGKENDFHAFMEENEINKILEEIDDDIDTEKQSEKLLQTAIMEFLSFQKEQEKQE